MMHDPSHGGVVPNMGLYAIPPEFEDARLELMEEKREHARRQAAIDVWWNRRWYRREFRPLRERARYARALVRRWLRLDRRWLRRGKRGL